MAVLVDKSVANFVRWRFRCWPHVCDECLQFDGHLVCLRSSTLPLAAMGFTFGCGFADLWRRHRVGRDHADLPPSVAMTILTPPDRSPRPAADDLSGAAMSAVIFLHADFSASGPRRSDAAADRPVYANLVYRGRVDGFADDRQRDFDFLRRFKISRPIYDLRDRAECNS